MMSWLLYIPAGLIEISHMKYQLYSTLDKILNLDILAKVQSQWTVKYRSQQIMSWLLYIPAGLILASFSYEISTCNYKKGQIKKYVWFRLPYLP